MSLKWTTPDVEPHAPIYFLMFTSGIIYISWAMLLIHHRLKFSCYKKKTEIMLGQPGLLSLAMMAR